LRRVPVHKLTPGMKLARPVFVKGGRVLLNAGCTLKESYINRLSELGITHVYVEDERVADVQVEEIVNEETRLRAAEIVRKAVANTRFGTRLNVEEVKNIVSELMDQILSHKETVAYLSEIRIIGEPLFHHSVNVAVYSIFTGLLRGYDEGKLRELGTGALLHDIGKSKLPASLLETQGPISGAQLEEVKNHTVYGFELLRKETDFGLLVAHIAFQHHENFDGSGYPRGLKGEEIHEYARITAVANIYDRLVSGLEGEKVPPHQAVEYLVAQSGLLLDPLIVRLFSTNIAVYPVGSMVRLTTGETGVVVHIPKNYPTRPKVRILYDREGNPYHNNFPEIDLLQELTVFVEEVLEE